MNVEPFTRDTIEQHLRRATIRYLRDEDGHYLAIHGPPAGRTVDLHVWYSAEGPNEDVYSIRVTTPHYHGEEQRPLLLDLLNYWSCGMRWPKVYLRPASPSLLHLVAESQLDLSCGLHPAAFDHFSLSTVAMADTFFGWIEAELGAIDFDARERWLGEAS